MATPSLPLTVAAQLLFFSFVGVAIKPSLYLKIKNKNKNLSKKLVSMLQQITVCFFKISIFRSRLVCEIDP
jgi:hypothetical protein